MFIHQHWLQRFGAVVPGGVVAFAGIITVKVPTTSADLVVLALFVGVPAWLVIRSLRAGVECADDRLLIRGWFWSRSIPKDRVVNVTRWRTVEWTSRRGTKRFSPLVLFWNMPRSANFIDSYNEAAVFRIRRWLKGEADYIPRHLDQPPSDSADGIALEPNRE